MIDVPTIRMIGDRQMQCKDIPDIEFLNAVRRTQAPGHWRMRWNVQAELEKVTGPIPSNLLLAKARKLIGARKLGGCPCGCRGDYHPPEECYDPKHCCPTDSNTETP